MRKCTTSVNVVYDGKVYEFPVFITNLTKYTDGVEDLKHTKTPDGKRSIMFGRNYITEGIKLSHRIMINSSSVYELVHIDNFSSEGILEFIALQRSISDKDDLLLNLAYNSYDNVRDDNVSGIASGKIIGNNFILSGATSLYKKDNPNLTWHLDCQEDGIEIASMNDDEIVLKASRGSKYIGNKAFLSIIDTTNNDVVSYLEIKIKGFA